MISNLFLLFRILFILFMSNKSRDIQFRTYRAISVVHPRTSIRWIRLKS